MFLLAQDAAAGQWSSLSSGSLFSNDISAQKAGRYIGTGVQYEFDQGSNRWVNFIIASQIIDASQSDAYLAGAGVAKRVWFGDGNHQLHLDLGIVTAAVQRSDYSDADTIFTAVPTFSLGTRKIAFYVSLLTNSRYNLDNVLIFQLKLAQQKFW